MKILGLSFGGIGHFRGNVVVPIDDLDDARLVAVVGDNGEGKSTMLGVIPGAVWRTCPGRGAIAALANRKDSFAELRFKVGDAVMTARLLIDGVARTHPTEAYLLAEGAPVSDGKARTFDAEIAKRMPPLPVYLASAFAAQGGEGRFLDMPAAGRKELFARLLGLAHLQELAAAAGERARAAELRAQGLRSAADTLRRQADRRADASTEVARLEAELAAAAEARAAAEKAAEESQVAVDAWRAETARLVMAQGEAASRLREANTASERARHDVANAEERLAKACGDRAGLEVRLGRRAELQAEASRGAAARERMEGIDADLARLRMEHQAAASARGKGLEAQVAWGKRRTDLERQHDKAAADLRAAEQAAAGAGAVPCRGEGEFATCSLIARATGARAQLAALRSKVAAAAEAMESQPPAPELGPAPDYAPIADLERQRQGVAAEADSGAKASTALAALDVVATRASQLDAEAAELRRDLGDLRADSLVRTAARGKAEVDHQAAVDAVAALGPAPAGVDPRTLAAVRRAETEAASDLAGARQVLAAAEAAAAELVGAEAKIAEAAADLDDWRHLQAALGKDGVQALEIDAAGPEVSDLCNQLLHACYGSRFTVSLETAALKADGSGTKEVFDLRVLDTERGTDGPADLLSGGEQVLVSEALALAICIFNARRSSVPLEDLIRDECSGALSEANATRYIEMLRRALDLGAFHRVFFVAHQRHLWTLADAVLEVKDGNVRVAQAEDVVVRAREEASAA